VDSCHLPLRTIGGSYYRAKLNSSSPIHNKRQEISSERTTRAPLDPGPSTEVTVEKDQSDHSPPLERIQEGQLEIISNSSTIPDLSDNWSSGISPCHLPPITVLINNLSLEGIDWTEALKKLSLNIVSLNCPVARQDRSCDPPPFWKPPPPPLLKDFASSKKNLLPPLSRCSPLLPVIS
jgi:hypothetical protein